MVFRETGYDACMNTLGALDRSLLQQIKQFHPSYYTIQTGVSEA